MASLAAQVLPFALGASVSPTLLTAELLILAGKKDRKRRAWMFVLGATVTILAVGLAMAYPLRNLNIDGKPTLTSILVRVVLAALLFYLGVRALRKPQRSGPSAIQQRVSGAKPLEFAGVGAAAMLANFSTLVLILPAVHLIVHSDVSQQQKFLVGAMLLGITVLPFVLPVLIATLFGHRADAVLTRLNEWTTDHSRQLNAGICWLFAAIFAWSALQQILKLGT